MKKTEREPAEIRDRGTGGRFARGNRIARTAGRPKGKPNRSTILGREILALLEGGDGDRLPAQSERLVDLLGRVRRGRDLRLLFDLEKWIHEALYGRAPQSVAVVPAVAQDEEIHVQLVFGTAKPYTSRAASPARSSPGLGNEPRDFPPDDCLDPPF